PGADRIQILALSDNDAAGAMADLRMVPKGIALDGRTGRAGLDSAAVADLKLGAPAAVTEQCAGVVASTDRIIARREILEAQQWLPRLLGAQPQRESEHRDWPQLAVGSQPKHRRVRLAFETARRDNARAEAIDSQGTAIARRAQCAQALAKLE